jgi:hypothetical protein
MVVVARQQGHYGQKPRYPGERFAIQKRSHFSKRWMLDPDDPAAAQELKSLERKFQAERPNSSRKADVSDETLLQELAASGGALAALRAENAQLKQRIKELEGGDIASKEPEQTDATDASEAGGQSEDQEPAATAGREDAEDGDAGETTRPTRRRRGLGPKA